MSDQDNLAVTVNRITEDWMDDPKVTLHARAVSIQPDGALVVMSEGVPRRFEAGHWEKLEVKVGRQGRLPRTQAA